MIKESGKIYRITFPAKDYTGKWVVNVHREYAGGFMKITKNRFNDDENGKIDAIKYIQQQQIIMEGERDGTT